MHTWILNHCVQEQTERIKNNIPELLTWKTCVSLLSCNSILDVTLAGITGTLQQIFCEEKDLLLIVDCLSAFLGFRYQTPVAPLLFHMHIHFNSRNTYLSQSFKSFRQSWCSLIDDVWSPCTARVPKVQELPMTKGLETSGCYCITGWQKVII